jgi:hypothetical protein
MSTSDANVFNFIIGWSLVIIPTVCTILALILQWKKDAPDIWKARARKCLKLIASAFAGFVLCFLSLHLLPQSFDRIVQKLQTSSGRLQIDTTQIAARYTEQIKSLQTTIEELSQHNINTENAYNNKLITLNTTIENLSQQNSEKETGLNILNKIRKEDNSNYRLVIACNKRNICIDNIIPRLIEKGYQVDPLRIVDIADIDANICRFHSVNRKERARYVCEDLNTNLNYCKIKMRAECSENEDSKNVFHIFIKIN